ncbi:MAG: aminoacyl-tRNA hydrolase [Armatimonadota bacterium]|nr:aminoacyl-tRNA hydrolase [Armatimonadota bacterium]MCX7777856.1 aminoacyl-tRNA hydrolase [Armatimonadota bacterium]MDW8025848.1 aminoacyl-tRNA hydrolase [Armatimonadota bacterium]
MGWLKRIFKRSSFQRADYAIIGLGNPGKQYERTRHNVGFMLIDELAKRLNAKLRTRQCNSRLAIVDFNGIHLLLAKPMTFMNLSGEAVKCIVCQFGLATQHLLIALDDANLPLGRIRIRASGSHGGHRGIKSVIEALGTQDVPRLRIGIGAPPPNMDLVNFVLSPFEPHELDVIRGAIMRAADAAIACVTDGLEKAMSKFNL